MENVQYVEENTVSIFVPMTIKRRGGSATVILPKNAILEATSEATKPNYDYKLINAFAKAYKWQQSMKKSDRATINTIAEKENITSTYVGRILRLNLVAPDVVKAIVEGKQPRGLKLQDFMNNGVPELWHEQREVYKFI